LFLNYKNTFLYDFKGRILNQQLNDKKMKTDNTFTNSDGFMILQKGNQGASVWGTKEIGISVTKSGAGFSNEAARFFQLVSAAEILFAKRGDTWYFGVVPKLSSIKGYKLYLAKDKGFRLTAQNLDKRGMIYGTYNIGLPINSGGIDWYEMVIKP
jgi:hypothetical protein